MIGNGKFEPFTVWNDIEAWSGLVFDVVFKKNPALDKISRYTMIGNGKFEPFTIWNDIELRYRITVSQWTS